jgi:hypothetical protein
MRSSGDPIPSENEAIIAAENNQEGKTYVILSHLARRALHDESVQAELLELGPEKEKAKAPRVFVKADRLRWATLRLEWHRHRHRGLHIEAPTLGCPWTENGRVPRSLMGGL